MVGGYWKYIWAWVFYWSNLEAKEKPKRIFQAVKLDDAIPTPRAVKLGGREPSPRCTPPYVGSHTYERCMLHLSRRPGTAVPPGGACVTTEHTLVDYAIWRVRGVQDTGWQGKHTLCNSQQGKVVPVAMKQRASAHALGIWSTGTPAMASQGVVEVAAGGKLTYGRPGMLREPHPSCTVWDPCPSQPQCHAPTLHPGAPMTGAETENKNR